MDAFVLGTYLRRKRSNDDDEPIERFADGLNNAFGALDLALFVASLLIGLIGIYLSWSCNTLQGYNVFAKVVFAFFAWFFGLLYLIVYWLFRSPCRIA